MKEEKEAQKRRVEIGESHMIEISPCFGGRIIIVTVEQSETMV